MNSGESIVDTSVCTESSNLVQYDYLEDKISYIENFKIF